MTDEAELISRCLKGDADAWNEVFDRYYIACGRFVAPLSPTFSAEDIEEICQETFVTVVRNLSTFRRKSQLQTWIFRIAANKAHDYLERQRAQKRGGGEAPLSLDAESAETGLKIDPPSNVATPDQTLANRERLFEVHAALEQIGEPCRETIELRYFGDLSYDEIAEAMNSNVKTVSSRLSKCLDKLHELMTTRREKSESFSV